MNITSHFMQPENIVLVAAISLAFISPQQRNRKRMMGFKFVGDILFGVYYALMNGLSGGLACFIASCGSFIQLVTPRSKLKETVRLRILLAIMLSIGAILVSVRSTNDLLPILAVIYCRFVEIQSDAQKIRLGFFLSVFPWMAYNIENQMYGALICNIIIVTSLVIAIIRHRDLRMPKDPV